MIGQVYIIVETLYASFRFGTARNEKSNGNSDSTSNDSTLEKIMLV